MKRRNRGKHGDVALKIDMSKAYDQIDWGFLKLILLKLGFDDKWVAIMMLCVTTVQYQIRINGNLVGPIIPERGLRQGCPLSPYLFIICAQGLSTMIEKAEDRGTSHGVEKNWHIFIECPYAKECWKVAKLDNLVLDCPREVESFPNWLFEGLNKCPTAMQPNYSAVLWSIWRYRNEKLWTRVFRPPQITVSLGLEMVLSWARAQRKSPQEPASNSRQDEDDRWMKPPDPSMKCNVDAALFKEQRAVGFGAVVRDSIGTFMVSRSSMRNGWLEVKEAEALALLEAMQWTSSFELQDVIFESDSKTVVNAITSKNVDYTEFGSIICGCCQLIDAHPSFKIQHVRRQANMVAHTLARAAISLANPFITYHPPAIICNVINHDCGSHV
ncbi:uncharacterized protein [Primulina huaijiensis]|uniref:uncharacterized protein n=1 Tax=Primulina huaijiensis TaxID=1492673 RepID=UPI003CC6DF1E